MQRLDAIASWLVLGPMLPISIGIVGWWTGVFLRWTETAIASAALGGLLTGAILTLLLRHRWAGALFALSPAALCGVALWYSVMIYGFFMGLPVFNAAVGIVGGFVVGCRAALRGHDSERVQREARRWACFATSLLLLFCLTSAALALHEPSIGSEVQHMLGLPFEVTRGMIIALVVGGGIGLLAFQFLTAKLAVAVGSRHWIVGNPIL